MQTISTGSEAGSATLVGSDQQTGWQPVVLRERARSDIDEAVEHYLAEAGSVIAVAFVDALVDTHHRIGEQPVSGSPRYAHELDIPGLRVQSIRKFPYLVFYVEKDSEVDVWRVLHAARDIPAWMGEPSED